MIEEKREVRIEGVLDIIEDGSVLVTTFVENEGFTSEDIYNLSDILKSFEHENVTIKIESTNKGDFKIEQ